MLNGRPVDADATCRNSTPLPPSMRTASATSNKNGDSAISASALTATSNARLSIHVVGIQTQATQSHKGIAPMWSALESPACSANKRGTRTLRFGRFGAAHGVDEFHTRRRTEGDYEHFDVVFTEQLSNSETVPDADGGHPL